MHNQTIIFELVHIHANADSKRLGLYSGAQEISEAIKYYQTQLGFRDFPDGFVTIPHQVISPIEDSNAVYYAEAYYHDADYSLEFVAYLGIFANREDAEERLTQFKRANNRTLASDIEVELLAERYILNHRDWPEGFIPDLS